MFLPGLTNGEVEEATKNSINAGDDLLDFEIPLIATAIALGKNTYACINGRTDLKHGAINIAYDVTGRVIGGKIGSGGLALCGGLLGPYGVVVGGLVGAITGGIAGKNILSKFKVSIHTSKAKKEAEEAIAKLMEKSYNAALNSQEIFEQKINKLKGSLAQKSDTMQSLKNYIEKRIEHERRYVENKIDQIHESKSNPIKLASNSKDILLAGINATTLTMRAKVHPYTIRKELDRLIDRLEIIQNKRMKLS